MRKTEQQFHTLGICQKVFNFFRSLLSSRGLKHSSLHHEEDDDPREERVCSKVVVNADREGHHQSRRVRVHFKQREDEEEEAGQQILVHEGKNSGNNALIRGGFGQDPEQKIENLEEDERKKQIEQQQAKEHEKARIRYPRQWSVPSNINEISDAFIRRKKEAMRRNLSLEQKKK